MTTPSVPTPDPGPAAPGKAPPEALLAQIAQLVRDVASSADRDIAEVIDFLHRNKL
jgi:hypothetical protein